jgi:hypothetical protein
MLLRALGRFLRRAGLDDAAGWSATASTAARGKILPSHRGLTQPSSRQAPHHPLSAGAWLAWRNGYDLETQRRIEYDIYHIKYRSLLLGFQILATTLAVVFRQRNAF